MTVLLEHEAIVGSVEHVIDGADVRRRRQALRWSQDELAERAGLTSRTVSNAEHGKVGDAAAVRIVGALVEGEAERDAASKPRQVSVSQTIDTGTGEVHVTVTGDVDSVGGLDFTRLITELLRKNER